MKWNFIERKTYNYRDEYVSSTFTHKGIGNIEVSFEIEIDPEDEYNLDGNLSKPLITVDLFVGPRLFKTEQVIRRKALSTAKRMYLDLVKHKLTNDDVVLFEGNNVKIVDINSGQSLTLSKRGVDKLERITQRVLG